MHFNKSQRLIYYTCSILIITKLSKNYLIMEKHEQLQMSWSYSNYHESIWFSPPLRDEY